jgi:hypothetical protein
MMKKAVARTGVLLLFLLLLLGVVGCSANKVVEVDVPDNVKGALDTMAPRNEYAFYILESQLVTWDEFQEQGVLLCDLPPLTPKIIISTVNSGSFPSGTVINFDVYDVISTMGVRAMAAIGATPKSCAEWATRTKLQELPGLILLIKRSTDFEGKDELIEVSFK